MSFNVLCVENARVALVHKKPERTVMTVPNCALGCLFLHDARVVLQDVNNIPKFCNTVRECSLSLSNPFYAVAKKLSNG
jgi:hypothetical protein